MAAEEPLLEAIARLFGPEVRIVQSKSVGGGCINETRTLSLSNGTRLFLKENSMRYPGLFEAEERGLRALTSQSGPRVPRPLASGAGEREQFLLLEHVDTGSPGTGFWEDFGRALARLHRLRRCPRFGFDVDNYIGSTPQPNDWQEDWIGFFAQKRLGYQLELAGSRGVIDADTVTRIESIIGRLGKLLPDIREASILHGDLWGGNFMCDAEGRAVLIDPAVYWGHPEADIAMTELFGGFSRSFYAAYLEENPFDPGFDDRKELYNLYHLLNHLNLFGGSYLASVRAIARRYG